MVELLGMRPMDAIVSATSTNARAFGWECETGSIRPGLQADLLVVDRDPLADIGVLGMPERIYAIYRAGERVERPQSPPTRRRMGHERGFGVSTATLHRDHLRQR